MKYFKKYKIEIFIFAAILFAYFFSRLYNIMSLPLFTDEAIYVRWSQIARYDAAWRFISLTDGKQPSFVWIAMNIMRIVDDPLLAGRLVSVFAGFFSVVGIFFLGKEIFKNRWVGILSSAIYVIFPMALVYDRMALYDSLVGAFAIWGLYFEILLIRNLRLDIALILGMVTGGAILTKTSGFFNIYLLPFTLLLFDLKAKKKLNRFAKWVGLVLISVFLAFGFYSVLRLSPFFHIINEKNSVYREIRECLIDLEMDKKNIGTKEWSPLSEIISPGNIVVIKPNLVLNTANPDIQECTTTHPSVIVSFYCF